MSQQRAHTNSQKLSGEKNRLKPHGKWLLKHFLTICLVLGHAPTGVDCTSGAVGYDLWFTTNNRTYDRYRVPLCGSMPDWLRGTLIKMGLGQFELGPTSFTNAFDAYGKLTKVEFTGGNSLKFTVRMLLSESYTKSTRQGNIVPYMFLAPTDPPLSPLAKVEALIHNVDNPAINVYRFPSRRENNTEDAVDILGETWLMYRVDREDFSTAEKVVPSLSGNNGNSLFFNHMIPQLSSPHPIREYNSRNSTAFITVMSEWDPLPFGSSWLHLVRIGNVLQERQVLVSLPISRIPYMHSFGLSRNYAVLIADPFYIDQTRVLTAATLLESLEWKPKEPSRVHVFHLASGRMLFSADIRSGIHMHNVNSYEENGYLITDYTVYPDASVLSRMDLTVLRNGTLRKKIKTTCGLWRYTIHLKEGTVKAVKVSSEYKFIQYLDLPAINERYRFERYCYIYGISTSVQRGDFATVAIVKKDMCRGRDLYWFVHNHYPSEPTFIHRLEASGGKEEEDDGVITSIVLDGITRLSYVLVLDGKTFNVVSTAYLPTPLPFVLHGRFFRYLP